MVKERKTTFVFMAHWSRVVYVHERLIALENQRKPKKKRMKWMKKNGTIIGYTWEIRERKSTKFTKILDYEMDMCFTNAYSEEEKKWSDFLDVCVESWCFNCLIWFTGNQIHHFFRCEIPIYERWITWRLEILQLPKKLPLFYSAKKAGFVHLQCIFLEISEIFNFYTIW